MRTTWEITFAIMILIETFVLVCVVNEKETLQMQVTAKTPQTEFCTQALDRCNSKHEIKK